VIVGRARSTEIEIRDCPASGEDRSCACAVEENRYVGRAAWDSRVLFEIGTGDPIAEALRCSRVLHFERICRDSRPWNFNASARERATHRRKAVRVTLRWLQCQRGLCPSIHGQRQDNASVRAFHLSF